MIGFGRSRLGRSALRGNAPEPDLTVARPVLIACAAQLLNAVNIGACPLMLPAIVGSLGGDAGSLSWLVASYAIVFGGLVLWGGKATDSHGIGRVLTLGFLVSAVGALIAVLAPTPSVLVVARAVQGAGAALAIPSGMAWLTASTGDPAVRSRRLSFFAASGAIGFAAGALAGGLMSDHLGWRSVFLAQFVVAAALSAAAHRSAPRRRVRATPSIQWGAFAMSAALALLVLAMYMGLRRGWLDVVTVVTVAVTGGIAVVAVLGERAGPNPMVPRRLWRIPGFLGVIASTGLLYAAWAGCYFYGAISLHEAEGLSMAAAALWLGPLAFGALAGAEVAARVLGRRPARHALIVAGGLLTALGALGASFLPLRPSSSAYLAVLLVAITGQALAFVAQSDLLVHLVGSGRAGIAGGLFTAAGQVGGGIGLAVLAIVADSTSPRASSGFPEVFWSAALIAVLAVLLIVAGCMRARRGEPSGQLPMLIDKTQGV